MPLLVGTRLGSYEIVAMLGAGGMGEVYKARDRKLDRDVAIKILPEALAGDPERIARFEREAKTLAEALEAAHEQGIIHRYETGRTTTRKPGMSAKSLALDVSRWKSRWMA